MYEVNWKLLKLAKTDKKILDKLLLHPQGLTLRQISTKLDIDRMHIHRRLTKMLHHQLIIDISKYPTFYRINKSKPSNSQFIFLTVQCPKCGCIQEGVHIDQHKKTCENESCLTEAGNRVVFWITDDRTIKYTTLGN